MIIRNPLQDDFFPFFDPFSTPITSRVCALLVKQCKHVKGRGPSEKPEENGFGRKGMWREGERRRERGREKERGKEREKRAKSTWLHKRDQASPPS